jgi:hypothetical protein
MSRGLLRFLPVHNVCETSYDLYTNEDLAWWTTCFHRKRRVASATSAFPPTARGNHRAVSRRFDCFEFVQIQLNYLDWTLQEAGRNTKSRGMGCPCSPWSLCAAADCRTARGCAGPAAQAAARAFGGLVGVSLLQALENLTVALIGMTTLAHWRITWRPTRRRTR